MSRDESMKTFLICLMVASGLWLLTVGSIIAYKHVMFDRGCGGHLKRAADANSVEIATQELEVALTYMKENKLTEGYTSVIYTTPDEDVGFWYKNITASLEELKSLPPGASPLERTNVLMKLRETLLDKHDGSEKVTAPSGIAVFPANAMFAILLLIPATILGISIVVLIIKD